MTLARASASSISLTWPACNACILDQFRERKYAASERVRHQGVLVLGKEFPYRRVGQLGDLAHSSAGFAPQTDVE
jgi:hypothetical protein